MTPLHIAALKSENQSGQMGKIIERLISFGANLNAQTKDGSTPLQLAILKGNTSNIDLLVTYIIDILLAYNYLQN